MDKTIIKDYLNQQYNILKQKSPDLLTQEKLEDFENKLLNSNLSTDQAIALIDRTVNAYTRKMEKISTVERHYELNDLFDCRIGENTLHIHVVPKSLKGTISDMGYKTFFNWTEEKLQDAFIKIDEILNLEENQYIDNVFAISPLIRSRKVQAMFEKYGFNVSVSEEDKFKNMFKGEKAIGQAVISKDEFSSMVKSINKTSVDR